MTHEETLDDTRTVICHTPDCVSEGVEYVIPDDGSLAICGGCMNLLTEDTDV